MNFEKDYFRYTGTTNISIKEMARDHSLRYLFFLRGRGALAQVMRKHMSTKYGINLGNGFNIGEGLYLGHAYGINVNPSAKLGKNCSLHKGCTIGQENRGRRKGAPILGDKVWVGINSTVVGKISIGDDVLIAPNTYVNCDVPSHSIVVGNPCKIISKDHATDGYITNCI